MLANLDSPRTRRAYRKDVKAFTAFAGVERPEEMRQVTGEQRCARFFMLSFWICHPATSLTAAGYV